MVLLGKMQSYYILLVKIGLIGVESGTGTALTTLLALGAVTSGKELFVSRPNSPFYVFSHKCLTIMVCIGRCQDCKTGYTSDATNSVIGNFPVVLKGSQL